jgi:hypothetical protein
MDYRGYIESCHGMHNLFLQKSFANTFEHHVARRRGQLAATAWRVDWHGAMP